MRNYIPYAGRTPKNWQPGPETRRELTEEEKAQREAGRLLREQAIRDWARENGISSR